MRVPRAQAATAAAAAFLSSSSRLSSTSITTTIASLLLLSSHHLSLAFQPQPSNSTSSSRAFVSTTTDSKETSSSSQCLSTNNNMSCDKSSNSRDEMGIVKTIRLGEFAKLDMHHYPSVGSTQDEAKRILKEKLYHHGNQQIPHFFAISASEQVNGRGTNGRQWIGAEGNTFVTIGVPMKSIPVPINMLPLKVGTIIATQAHFMLQTMCQNKNLSESIKNSADNSVTVKWPNDVLINGDKIAGVLIESEMDQQNNIWFLVGIGVNVAYAPTVPSTGPHRGRKASCLKDHVDCDIQNSIEYTEKAKELASLLAQNLTTWVASTVPTKDGKKVVEEWKQWAEFGQELTLRDEPGDEKVFTIGIEYDGRLRVKDRFGNERLLIADYLL